MSEKYITESSKQRKAQSKALCASGKWNMSLEIFEKCFPHPFLSQVCDPIKQQISLAPIPIPPPGHGDALKIMIRVSQVTHDVTRLKVAPLKQFD